MRVRAAETSGSVPSATAVPAAAPAPALSFPPEPPPGSGAGGAPGGTQGSSAFDSPRPIWSCWVTIALPSGISHVSVHRSDGTSGRAPWFMCQANWPDAGTCIVEASASATGLPSDTRVSNRLTTRRIAPGGALPARTAWVAGSAVAAVAT